MSTMNQLAIRLYRRLFGVPASLLQVTEGADRVLDGSAAVALVEAAIADAVAVGGDSVAAEQVWREATEGRTNLFGVIPELLSAEGARGALAAAVGQAMTGRRATLFINSAELAGSMDLLSSAVGRQLPLVIHLINRALPRQGEGSGSGHEALHLAADAGCPVLVAGNVQEAVDFTLIARRVAELALTPVVVAMDDGETAQAAQDVSLPQHRLMRDFLGAPDAPQACPTPAQQMLFGEQRRRMPRLHDLDQPMLQGSRQGADAFAQGAAAALAFFDGHLDGLLDTVFNEFAQQAGRRYARLSRYRLEESERVLLVLGSAVEAAHATADRMMAAQRGERVGVVGIHCLSPFPGGELVELLAGKRKVAVLERSVAPLAHDSHLLRELRAAFHCAAENQRHGADCHPGYPALEERRQPRLHSVLYGFGGLALNPAELDALCGRLDREKAQRLFLGVDFHGNTPEHPKRQVMLDQLRRAYPQLAGLGIRQGATAERDRAGVLAVDLLHQGESAPRLLPAGLGGLLQRALGGRTRCLPTHGELGWNRWLRDGLRHGMEGLPLGGSADLALVYGHEGLRAGELTSGIRKSGSLLLNGFADEESLVWALGDVNRAALQRAGVTLYHLPPVTDAEEADIAGLLPEEREAARLAGALCGVLLQRELLDLKPRRLLSAWQEGLDELDDAQQALLSRLFEQAMDEVQRIEPDAEIAQGSCRPAWSDEPPLAVRALGGTENTLDSLPRFWDQVGVLYRDGEAQRLSADPYLASGAIPPLSATFQDHSCRRDGLVSLDAERCNACGDCLSTCPDSAIAATALTPTRLLEAGIKATGAEALRPLAAKIGGRINAMGRKGEFRAAGAAELLEQAWQWLQEKAPLPEERRTNVEAGLAEVKAWIGDLPLMISDALFHAGEKEQKDGGELFALAINPDACKACGLCVSVCEEGALELMVQTPEVLATAERHWLAWEQTPDTGSHTIQRLIDGAAMNPLAALMMSRHCSLAMVGGDSAEAGSGERLALRMALAAMEYRQQPLLYRFTRELGEVKARLDAQIRDTLADALPSSDLELLEKNLEAHDGEHIDLAGLVSSTTEGGIESHRMGRLIHTTRRIHDHHWRLSEGKHGLGRARLGLVLTGASLTGWASRFPDNPFQLPVTVDMTGDAGELAAGLVQGQLAEAIEALQLLQEARELLGERKPLAEPLNWRNLDDEQRQLCPPLLLVGSERELGGRGFDQVAWLLNSGLPVKVLVLSESDLGLDSRGSKESPLGNLNDPRSDLALMALAQRDAYVAQSSIAEPGHFRQTVREALAYPGPALIRVYAPSPRRHGHDAGATLEQARLAVAARITPLFRYDPAGEGVFGSRLDMEGNGEARADWRDEATPMHWALGERRFRAHLQPLAEGDQAPTDWRSWLASDARGRQGKTPMIEMDGQRYRISAAFMERVDDLAQAWRLLQELAGLVTPFTERVRREAEADVAAARQAELAALKADHEAQLKAQAEGMQADMAGQIRERLMNLAGYN